MTQNGIRARPGPLRYRKIDRRFVKLTSAVFYKRIAKGNTNANNALWFDPFLMPVDFVRIRFMQGY